MYSIIQLASANSQTQTDFPVTFSFIPPAKPRFPFRILTTRPQVSQRYLRSSDLPLTEIFGAQLQPPRWIAWYGCNVELLKRSEAFWSLLYLKLTSEIQRKFKVSTWTSSRTSWRQWKAQLASKVLKFQDVLSARQNLWQRSCWYEFALQQVLTIKSQSRKIQWFEAAMDQNVEQTKSHADHAGEDAAFSKVTGSWLRRHTTTCPVLPSPEISYPESVGCPSHCSILLEMTLQTSSNIFKPFEMSFQCEDFLSRFFTCFESCLWQLGDVDHMRWSRVMTMWTQDSCNVVMGKGKTFKDSKIAPKKYTKKEDCL